MTCHNIDNNVHDKARILWDYHNLDLGLYPSDFILALGSHDTRVADHSAHLLLQGLAPILITSGGLGKVTRNNWKSSEGERFAERAMELGVPKSKILIEKTATNTGDNVNKTRDLLAQHGLNVSRGILVTKPYMRRRAYATAAKQWPEISWLVSSPLLSYDEYPDENVPMEQMIELMVGDLQRIKVYAETGFQVAQVIPNIVWQCYEDLVQCGFDKYVIKDNALP